MMLPALNNIIIVVQRVRRVRRDRLHGAEVLLRVVVGIVFELLTVGGSELFLVL